MQDKNASGLIDKEEFIKALQHPEELLAKPEQKKDAPLFVAAFISVKEHLQAKVWLDASFTLAEWGDSSLSFSFGYFQSSFHF